MRQFWRFFAFSFILTLACNMGTAALEPTADQQATAAVTDPLTDTPTATEAAATPSATAAFLIPGDGPPGFSRSRPFLPGEMISGENWRTQLL